jgi:hypothetical protein
MAIRQQILVAGDQVVRLARGQLALRALRRVLDTNVVVSGVLTPMGPPGHLLALVLAGEYREVLLCPRFGLDPAYVHQLIDALEEIGVQVTALPWPFELRRVALGFASRLHPAHRPFVALRHRVLSG